MKIKSRLVLVIGGSGMLSGLVSKLSDEYEIVGVLGRTKSKMSGLLKLPNIVPIYADYTSKADFSKALSEFKVKYGKPDLIITWIHDTRPEATIEVANLGSQDFYEITGSEGAENSHRSRIHEKEIIKLGIKYHRITLGRKGSRWLTNSEICEGVQNALKSSHIIYAIGEV